MVDTSVALQNLVIVAWAMGVGSCWIGDFKEENVKQLLNVPDRWKIIALVAFGYPSGKPSQKRKKSVEEIVSINKF